jgi:TonB family protein
VAALRRNAFEVSLTEEAAHCWTRCSKRFGVEGASIAASSNTFGPVTLGMRRKLVLLPSHMLTRLAMADLQTVMAHECAHIRRQDFVKNLLYELLSLPVSYHPALWLTRERVIESREMVCDQMAAEIAGPSEYARSLLRLVSLLISETPATAPHAIGIFDANTFERRLMRLTEKQKSVRGVWQFAVVAACAVLGIATCASAVALSVHVHAASESHTSNTSATGPLRVPASTMAANVLIRVQPKYPEAAKAAKIQGTIVLEAIISKTGTVENLHIISGPDELQPSSLDAVRQWTYKPYLLNGDPVEVTTTIKVIYSLQP